MIPRISYQKVSANAAMLGVDTKKVSQATKNKLSKVKFFDIPVNKQAEAKKDKFVKQLYDDGSYFVSWVC